MTVLIGQAREVIVRASWAVSLRVEWGSTIDPTAITPLFLVTAVTVEDPATTGWVDGAWDGAYGAAGTYWTYALTPTIGSSSTSFTLTSGNRYRLWMRVPNLGSEDEPLLCGTIRCP